MRTSVHFKINKPAEFKLKLVSWGKQFSPIAFFDSNFEKDDNSFPNLYPEYDCILAVKSIKEIKANSGSAFKQLHNFHSNNKDWLFGHLGYDLKNENEKLDSQGFDGLNFPDMFFFIPELILILHKDNIEVLFHEYQYASVDIASTLSKRNCKNYKRAQIRLNQEKVKRNIWKM